MRVAKKILTCGTLRTKCYADRPTESEFTAVSHLLDAAILKHVKARRREAAPEACFLHIAARRELNGQGIVNWRALPVSTSQLEKEFRSH